MIRARGFVPASVALAALLWAVPAPATMGSIETRQLVGVVRDGGGNLLQGVQVLLLSDAPGGGPLARASTDAHGRYAIAGLDPGVYRVAAVKPGYRTFLGSVNTFVSVSLDLLLQRGSGDAGLSPAPASADWVLRLPTRSILRETDETVPVSRPSEVETSGPRAEMPLRVRVDQSFVVGEQAHGPVAGTPLQGNETALSVGGLLGERAAIRLEGNRQSLDGIAEAASSRAASEHASVAVNMSYATGRKTNLDVRAFYERGDVDSTPLLAAAADASTQERRSWGYGAAWSLQVDPVSRLALAVDYRDLALEAAGRLADRRVGAGGSYETMPSDRHQLQVDVHAQFVASPGLTVVDVVRPAHVADPTGAGWVFQVDAEDQWALGGPLTLVGGLGYRFSPLAGGGSAVVPRVGGVWTPGPVSMKLVLSWAGTSSGRWTGEERARDGGNGIGYLARVNVPLTRSLALGGEKEFSPVLIDSVGYPMQDPDAIGRVPLFLGDGDVALRRSSLSVTHDALRIRTSLRYSRGTAEGQLAPLPHPGMPIRLLSQRELDFADASLGIRVNASGTELSVAHREIRQAAEPAATAFVEQAVELRVAQDLMRMLQGTWRVLFAARVAASAEGEAVAPAGQQFSAGLSVTF